MANFPVSPSESGTIAQGAYPMRDGWSMLAPSGDSREVYVSQSSGDDANDGLSPGQAKQTIAAGYGLLRNGFPDWLYLAKGDTWTDEIFPDLTKSGRSELEPMVVTSYGTGARPLLNVASGAVLNGTFNTEPPIEHLAFVGLHFYQRTNAWYDPAFDVNNSVGIGISMLRPFTNMLFEDMFFQALHIGFRVENRSTTSKSYNLRIRRCLVVDHWSDELSSGGAFIYDVQDLTFRQNVFDHNGWGVSRDDPVQGASILEHNIYIQEVGNSNTLFIGNIVTDGGSHGLHLRSGGWCADNVFARNPIVQWGYEAGEYPDGITVTVDNNLFLNGNDIASNALRGYQEIQNIKQGLFSNNLIVHDISKSVNTRGLRVGGTTDRPTRDLTIDSNVWFEWLAGGPVPVFEPAQVDFLSQNNYYWGYTQQGGTHINNKDAATQNWVDSNRDAATYNQSIGGTATYAAYITEVRSQSKDNWRTEYTSLPLIQHIRDGFQLQPTGGGLDTPNGRASALCMWPNLVTPEPDGTINAADRAHINWVFRARFEIQQLALDSSSSVATTGDADLSTQQLALDSSSSVTTLGDADVETQQLQLDSTGQVLTEGDADVTQLLRLDSTSTVTTTGDADTATQLLQSDSTSFVQTLGDADVTAPQQLSLDSASSVDTVGDADVTQALQLDSTSTVATTGDIQVGPVVGGIDIPETRLCRVKRRPRECTVRR